MPTIIFKATEQCNARCVYCDVVVKKAPKIMPLQLLELVFQRINDYLEEFPHENISLIWHGGEPLILGVEYFEKAIEFQDKHCPNTKHRIEHAMQSNLTLMDEAYIEIFRKLNIKSLGSSFEPIQGIRGIGKKVNSELYNKKFFEGVNLLEKNGIGWGYIYVVTKKALEDPLKVFYYLSNLKLTGGFMMNPVLVYGKEGSEFGITPMEYVEFLGKIFPVWWQHRKRFQDVEPFGMFTKYFEAEGDHLGCVDSGNCAYHHLYIGPSGETSQCGRAEDWGIIKYKNIQEASIKEILTDPIRDQMIYRTEFLEKNDCNGCRFWGICHGGCPLDAWKEGDEGFMRKTYWCEVRKVFLSKYFEPITGYRFEKEKQLVRRH